jgi:hypothetical protein
MPFFTNWSIIILTSMAITYQYKLSTRKHLILLFVSFLALAPLCFLISIIIVDMFKIGDDGFMGGTVESLYITPALILSGIFALESLARIQSKYSLEQLQ